ncbi:MAG: ribose 5-phosphate isomerase B [Fibrobacter sp.]|jgi:RpiB/LacA/LacB family sugar-phosphate isomerase|nr:ribose 5-phosphate isomerase B [Fibrobacter sp.]
MTENAHPILIGSDHAGYEMKEFIKQYLSQKNIPFEEAGTAQYDETDDYPLVAFKLAQKISSGEFQRGILLCGTGIGASIAANRVKGVRAALCSTPETARMSRLHNNSNVLVLGGRVTSREMVPQIINAWLEASFEGGRHQRRIEMLDSSGNIATH